MSVFKKTTADAAREAGILSGNNASKNVQNATNAAVKGMKYFQAKVSSPIIQNGAFDQGKGNLFEYIEAAKFNVDAASKGSNLEAHVTDIEDPHAAADILIKQGSKIEREVQAKFVKSSHLGRDSSAAQSVHDQAGLQKKSHIGKYDGMQRLIRKQENYNTEGSLLDEAKKLAKERSDSNSIYANEYKDVYENLTDELHHGNVHSGGTTFEEVRSAYDKPKTYAQKFERKIVLEEMKYTAASMAKASFLSTGLVSGITNMVSVFQDKKELGQAVIDVKSDALNSAIRGATTGTLSTAIRYEGLKNENALLSDSTASTVMAGGLIDGGVALLSYAKGEIDENELKESLLNTTAKASTTIFFSKAVKEIMGKNVAPIVPFAVYTTASYVFTATREIIKNAELEADEFDRMAAIYNASKKQMEEYNKQIQSELAQVASSQKQAMNEFLESFNYNLATGENYDEALNAIVKFANQAGIALQHASFSEFSDAMKRKDVFVLE